jgi:predicted site-specific integrase-resolvase
MATSRRAALYVRVSTSDRGQTIENQLQPLHEAARRLGWTVVAVLRDEGISGTRGRDKRPGLDALLKGVARREFDIVAAWSVCRLGRAESLLCPALHEPHGHPSLWAPRTRRLAGGRGELSLDRTARWAILSPRRQA